MRRSPLSFLRRRNKNVVLSNNDYRTSHDVAETPETVILASQPPLCTATIPTNKPFANSAHDDPVLTDGRFGIETIWNPPNADMDIWFVHGLTGDRETTWKHTNGISTPSLIRTRFPSARIISYGYDANVVGLWKNASGDGLRGHGKALAYAISNTRRKETERPLFFIAHSLGGLVTEQALLISLEPSDPRLHTIAPCTAGIIFMGTPHSGADLAAWGCALAKVIDPIRRVNKELLSVLKQRSEVLKAVQETFQRQLTSNGAFEHVKIFCFYETVAVNLVGFVVPEESATMRQHPNCGIDANHMDMTKFTGLQDASFINLEGVLNDWIERGKVSKSSDVKSKVEEKASSMAMTFSNGPITTNVFQQGTGNAGRDINHGNVAYQMA